jgi:hypothetical protein
LEGSSSCIFEPGLRLVFHRAKGPPVELLLCLKCADASVSRDGREIGFASFARGREKVIAMARTIFPTDKGIAKFIEERDIDRKRSAAAEARWRAGMPEPLRPLKEQAMTYMFGADVNPLRATLQEGMPDGPTRILALLSWYGSGDGPWSGFPAYEEAAEKLLLDYSTSEILAAIEVFQLTHAETEGAARLFGGWTFSRERPGDLELLPVALKEALAGALVEEQ